MRLSTVRRCVKCDREVAWRDANYGWCVGCMREDLEPNERLHFDRIRRSGFVPETSVPPEIIEILLWYGLISVSDSGYVIERRH